MLNFKIIMYPHALRWGKPPTTTSTRIFRIDFPVHPSWIFFWTTLTIFIYDFFGQNNITRGKAQRPSACSYTQPAHPHEIAPLPYLQLITTRVFFFLHHRAIMCNRMPLEEHLGIYNGLLEGFVGGSMTEGMGITPLNVSTEVEGGWGIIMG